MTKKLLFFSSFSFLLIMAAFILIPDSAQAALGDGASSNIQFFDTNQNGQIDQITFDIANPNNEIWATTGASPHGITVYQDVNSIAISSVSIISGVSANPIIIQIDLDETDPNLISSTDGITSGVIELIYTQAGFGNTPNIQDIVDEELNAINTGDTGPSDTEIDKAAPIIRYADYQDINNDGQIERVFIGYSETSMTCNFEAGDWTVNNPGSINLSIGNCTSILLNVSADPDVTGGPVDPQISYTNQGTLDSVQDPRGNGMPTLGPITVNDTADPIIISREYQDNGSDGSVDRLVLGFSEAVYWNGNDLNQFAIVNNNLTNFDSDGSPDSLLSGSGTSTLTLSTSGTSNLTGVSGATEPTVQYTRSASSANWIFDSVPNFMPSETSAYSIDDKASPMFAGGLNNPSFLDNDGNGQVDEVHVLFTEDVNVTYNDSHWIIVPNDLADLDVTGVNVNNDNIIEFAASVSSISTGVGTAGTAPTLELNGDATSVQDADSNSYSAFGPVSIYDLAKPVVTSTTPPNGQANVPINQDVVINFSEPMDTTFTYGTQYTSSPDPGAWSAVWSNSDKTVTLSHNNYTYNTTVTFDTDETQINATGGPSGYRPLNVSGSPPAPNDWLFVTQSGGGGGGAALYPSNTSILINEDAAETDSREVMLSLYADDATSMLISEDPNFGDASWEPYDTSKSWTLSEGYGTKTVYVKFRSEALNQSSAVSDSIDYVEQITEPVPEPVPEFPGGLAINDLVKGPDHPAVYALGNDGKRHAFPNEPIYFSYYADFSSVQVISNELLASISLGDNVTMRPGTWMIKVQSVNKVYAVEPGGVIRWVTSEAVAEALYTGAWSSRIVDISPAFWTDYTEGANIDDATYPTASLIQYDGEIDVYYIENSEKRYVSSSVFSNSLFRDEFVIKGVSSAMTYPDGADLPQMSIANVMFP